ncbi:MAG: hypothetical protein KGH55_01955 [Nanoarchaeota archaeon]|nr:hypothetical protein [Nanoarchaeota archaeon]
MNTCIKCGISSENATLYDAISTDGLVKICANCNVRENLPLLKKTGPITGEKRQTVYERMTRLSGYNPGESGTNRKKEEVKKQDEEIKMIMEKNYRDELYNSGTQKDISGESNLVRNFHWEILKARRARHMTQQQLADIIGEPELAIRMAERGILPRERERLVKKIESYLGIRIMKGPSGVIAEQKQAAEQPAEEGVPIEEIRKKFSIRDLFGLGKKKRETEESTEEHSEEEK